MKTFQIMAYEHGIVTKIWWARVWILSLLLFIARCSFAQIGTWQSYVSYQSGQSVAVVSNKVYAASLNGFFYYDKTTQETVQLGKNTSPALSDVGISRLLYLTDQNRLLIAYRNGNLDLLTVSASGDPVSVQNINTIVSSSNLPQSRTINHLNRIGNSVYLSTDFGLIVFDLTRSEIRDTYFSLRPDGSPLPILQTTATTDSLYALTAPVRAGDLRTGLQAIRLLANVNIADPANWRTVALPGSQPGAILTSLLVAQNRLLAAASGQGVFSRQTNQWVLTQSLPNQIIILFPAGNDVGVATNQRVALPSSGSFTGPLLANPREVVVDGNQIWVADVQSGLLLGSASAFQRIAPEGPTRDLFTQLYTYPQTLVALPSVPLDATTQPAGQAPSDIYSLSNGRWLSSAITGLDRGFDAAAYLPAEQRLYLGSFGGGLWSQTEGQAPMVITLPATIGPFITSLATDIDGNLWITTGGSNARQATLHVRRPDGQFQSFPIVSQTNIVQVVPDDNGFLWLRPDIGGGVIVVDPQGNRIRYLTTERGQGSLPTNSVRTLVKDRNGAIWVGTDQGPTVFDNPAGAFDAVIDAQPPLLNRRRLLPNETIAAIAVDGGNRKWLGTRTGLYQVAPDGSQLLETFTVSNSPLPNNPIQALAIEPTSGKVFIQTANGLFSYGGSATEPAETLSTLTIFPNPVRPDFTGTVSINGLIDNATVKILDAGGQLVYETRSQGGTATWNLRDYRGRSAQTGIYLVVVVAADGSEGLAGKLAVVR